MTECSVVTALPFQVSSHVTLTSSHHVTRFSPLLQCPAQYQNCCICLQENQLLQRDISILIRRYSVQHWKHAVAILRPRMHPVMMLLGHFLRVLMPLRPPSKRVQSMPCPRRVSKADNIILPSLWNRGGGGRCFAVQFLASHLRSCSHILEQEGSIRHEEYCSPKSEKLPPSQKHKLS